MSNEHQKSLDEIVATISMACTDNEQEAQAEKERQKAERNAVAAQKRSEFRATLTGLAAESGVSISDEAFASYMAASGKDDLAMFNRGMLHNWQTVLFRVYHHLPRRQQVSIEKQKPEFQMSPMNKKLWEKERHFTHILQSTIKKNGLMASREQIDQFLCSDKGKHYFSEFLKANPKDYNDEDRANLAEAAGCLAALLNSKTSTDATPSKQPDHVSQCEQKQISETPPVTHNQKEHQKDNLENQVSEFLQAHKYRNFTAYDVSRAMSTHQKEVAEVLHRMIQRHNLVVIGQTVKRNTQYVSRYKYCPEWREFGRRVEWKNDSESRYGRYIVCYDSSVSDATKLHTMCRVIRQIVEEFPGINHTQIRRKLKDYLLGGSTTLIEDALYLMAQTSALVAERGNRGAKLYSYNPDWRNGGNVRLYNQIMQSERFAKYSQ